jgi:hypothetical protein
LILEANRPFFNGFNMAVIYSALGAATAFYVISGALPMLGWAVARFKSEFALTPFMIWPFLAVGVFFLAEKGNRFDREMIVADFAKGVLISGKEKDDFVRTTKIGCVDKQRSSTLNVQISSEAQISISLYCACYSKAIADVITLDELKYLAMNGRPSSSLQEKADRLAPVCLTQARREMH